jgi:hypothetical protein
MCQHDARISQRYSKESQSSSPVDEPRVYRIGVMGSRDPSQSVGPSNTSPLAVPEAELISNQARVISQRTVRILSHSVQNMSQSHNGNES